MGNARYTVIIERDPDEELYVASVPALSVGSYGTTIDEAMDKIREAVEVTIDGLKATGQPVPLGDGDRVGFLEVAI